MLMPGTKAIFAPFSLPMRLLTLSILTLICGLAQAQYPLLVDKVVAQVGDRIVLKSDIEFQYLQFLEEGIPPEDVRCDLLDQMIAQRLLILQAEEDSVIISDDEVELELNRRFDYFISLLGSQEKLEEFYGKPIVQLKDDFREDIANQLLAQRMQGQISGDLRISPAEVRDFYRRIPKDSLPYFDAEVEIAHLALIPTPTRDQKEYARDKAQGLLERVQGGESIEFLAPIYSDDPGSKEQGGYLGCLARGETVPEFEAAAFRLKNGDISEVVESQFGFHIIEMIERKGESACLRHILISPRVTSTNLAIASSRLDSIKREIEANLMTFEEAVNPVDGSTFFAVDELDRETYFAIEPLAVGDISSPQPWKTPAGKDAYRLILLRSESEPHVADLDKDYSKIQAAALQEKRLRIMEEWLAKRLEKTYLRIDPVFAGCSQSDRWSSAAAGGIKNEK
jgi:peptidyl-prolyl cis-trans isomerase SurA